MPDIGGIYIDLDLQLPQLDFLLVFLLTLHLKLIISASNDNVQYYFTGSFVNTCH
jgi:hypothetical protein